MHVHQSSNLLILLILNACTLCDFVTQTFILNNYAMNNEECPRSRKQSPKNIQWHALGCWCIYYRFLYDPTDLLTMFFRHMKCSTPWLPHLINEMRQCSTWPITGWQVRHTMTDNMMIAMSHQRFFFWFSWCLAIKITIHTLKKYLPYMNFHPISAENWIIYL